MKRFYIIILLLSFCLASFSQEKNNKNAAIITENKEPFTLFGIFKSKKQNDSIIINSEKIFTKELDFIFFPYFSFSKEIKKNKKLMLGGGIGLGAPIYFIFPRFSEEKPGPVSWNYIILASKEIERSSGYGILNFGMWSVLHADIFLRSRLTDKIQAEYGLRYGFVMWEKVRECAPDNAFCNQASDIGLSGLLAGYTGIYWGSSKFKVGTRISMGALEIGKIFKNDAKFISFWTPLILRYSFYFKKN